MLITWCLCVRSITFTSVCDAILFMLSGPWKCRSILSLCRCWLKFSEIQEAKKSPSLAPTKRVLRYRSYVKLDDGRGLGWQIDHVPTESSQSSILGRTRRSEKTQTTFASDVNVRRFEKENESGQHTGEYTQPTKDLDVCDCDCCFVIKFVSVFLVFLLGFQLLKVTQGHWHWHCSVNQIDYADELSLRNRACKQHVEHSE